MADRDESQHDDADIRPEEFRQRFDGVASGIDVGDLELARSNVDGVVGRRRTRRRVGATLGAAAVIALVATTAVLTIGGDEPDTLVTTDDTVAPDTTPDDGVDSPEPTLALPLAAAQPVELIEGTARPGSVAGADGAPEYGEWIVPWEDGFLVGSTSFPPQPLPDQLPDDVIALFPQEVIDLFDGDLPATISEATEKLSEAGLLEVVSEVIQANPAAYDAIYGVQTDAPTLDVQFTVDGVTWEPREMVLPAGATYVSSVTAVGDRLAVVFANEDPLTFRPVDGTITVANTTDLINWSTQEVVVPSPDLLPDGINWNVFAQGLIANEGGWVLSVYDSIDADPYSLLPAEVQAEIDADGAGLSIGTDGQGVTIEYGFDAEGNNPTESRTYTWEELGLAPEVGELLDAQTFEPTLWTSSWEGVPVPTDVPAIGGPMAATPEGFLMWTDQTWFSPDGITWTASPLPSDESWVSGAFSVDGGLVIASSTNSGATLIHRVDDRGENAVLLDLALPANGSFSLGGPPGGSSTSGAIVAVSPPIDPEEQLTVEVDGYRLSLIQQSGVFEVVELATGEVIVSENPFLPGNEDSLIQLDETGVAITDATTGEPLVVFPAELLDAAESEFFDDGGGDYNPDFWLLASLDGERFVVEDIDDVDDGPTTLATNGTRLLLQSGTNWIIYDLA